MNEAKSDLEEAERTRDVALTALFAGVQQSAEVGQHVQKIKEDLGGKLSTRDMQVFSGFLLHFEEYHAPC